MYKEQDYFIKRNTLETNGGGKPENDNLEDILQAHNRDDLKKAYYLMLGILETDKETEDITTLKNKLAKTNVSADKIKSLIFQEEEIDDFLNKKITYIFKQLNTSEREIVTLKRKLKDGNLEKMSIILYRHGDFVLEDELNIDRTNLTTILESIESELNRIVLKSKETNEVFEITTGERANISIGIQFEDFD